MKRIFYNEVNKQFSIVDSSAKLFSATSNSDLEEFKKLESILSDYNINSFGFNRQVKFKNEKVLNIFYDYQGRRGSCIKLEEIEGSDILNYIEFPKFNSLKIKRRPSEHCVDIVYKDYDLLASFFRLKFEKKSELIMGYNIVKLTNDLTFEHLVDEFNEFQKGLKLNFFDIKNVISLPKLNNLILGKVKSDIEIGILDHLIRFQVFGNDKGIFEVSLHKDKKLECYYDKNFFKKYCSDSQLTELENNIKQSTRNGFEEFTIEGN